MEEKPMMDRHNDLAKVIEDALPKYPNFAKAMN
jgi:hypothetical protein